MSKLWLTEAIKEYKIIFKKGRINIVNSHAGSGKSYFIYNELMKNPNKYMDVRENPKFLYVADTSALKDSIIYDLNIDVAVKRRMIDKFNDKKGNVYTYSRLADACIDNPYFLDSFDVIICDEMQNLYNYKLKHKGNYGALICHLERIYKTKIIIGLSATPRVIFQYSEKKHSKANYYRVFNLKQLETIRNYNMDMKPMNKVFNFIKTYDFDEKPSEKIVIHVDKITTANSIQEWLTIKGIQAISLSSKSSHNNALRELKNNKDLTAEETDELKRKVMTDEQLKFRDELLTDKVADDGTSTRGQLQNYRVLILTMAYETGINIYDKDVGVVLVATSNRDNYIQARSRVRHDVRLFYVYPPKGYEDVADDFTDIPPRIDEKYFNIPIDKPMEKELVEQYGLVFKGKEKTNLKSVEEYFESHGYVFATIDKEFRLFHSEEEIEEYKTSKKETKKMAKREVKVDKIKKYLDGIIGVELNKEQQNELVRIINLRDSIGRLLKSTKVLKPYLLENYDILLVSKPNKIDRKRVWILSY